MELGMVGLGKMGGNMARRLLQGGHGIVGFDVEAQSVADLVRAGAQGVLSLEDLVGKLPQPRAVWTMLPSGAATEETVQALDQLLAPGDTVLDGGNSYYKDSLRRAGHLGERGIHFVDVGTSGGIWGLENGYSLMVGGDADVVDRHRALFESLAPAKTLGWAHVGPVGSGHFVKMVHNAVEYGLMQAYAEGFELLAAKEEFSLDLAQVANVWRHGSVVRSWLLDLTADLLSAEGDLRAVKGWVPDTGEGRWAVVEAIDQNLSLPVITQALERRLRSRESEPLSDKILAALRQKFGGHAIERSLG